MSFSPATGRLAAGNRSIPLDTGSMTLSWPARTPFFAPTDEAPRRKPARAPDAPRFSCEKKVAKDPKKFLADFEPK